VSLGFQSDFDASKYPFRALSESLTEARQDVPLTDRNEPVVPAYFNPYRSCLIAPDHLLFGLAQDVLRAAISLFSPSARRVADALMRTSLLNSNLGNQKQIINPTSASVNSIGTSVTSRPAMAMCALGYAGPADAQ
jgi:hypothetical protein